MYSDSSAKYLSPIFWGWTRTIDRLLPKRTIASFCPTSWGFIAIYAVLLLNLLFTLFCREIYFATIYALSCGEKLSPKVHLWRKMTNIRSVPADPISLNFGTDNLQLHGSTDWGAIPPSAHS